MKYEFQNVLICSTKVNDAMNNDKRVWEQALQLLGSGAEGKTPMALC